MVRPPLLLAPLVIALLAGAVGVAGATAPVTDGAADAMTTADTAAPATAPVASPATADPWATDAQAQVIQPLQATDPGVVAPDAAIPARLWLGEDAVDGTDPGTSNVGVAVDADGAATEARFQTLTFTQELDAADDDTAVVAAGLDEIQETTDDLQEREREAVAAYQGGAIGERALLAELGRIASEAEATATYLETVAEESDQDQAEVAETLDMTLLTHWTELTEGYLDIQRGERMPARLHVAAVEDGVAMAMIEDETYARAAVYRPHFDPAGSLTLPFEDVSPFIEDQYPILGPGIDRIVQVSPGGVYEVSASQNGHTVQSNVDGRTEAIFKEHVTLDLDQVTTGETAQATDGGLDIRINATYPGGPALIQTTDVETNQPVSATVLVDNETVGTTDDEGNHWFVAPHDPATVEVTTDDQQIVTTAQWAATNRSGPTE